PGLHRTWSDLFLLHDVWISHYPCSSERLEAGRISSTRPSAWSYHHRERCTRSSLAHSTVLAAVDCPMLQRHRRHRYSRAGIADDTGNVRRKGYGGGGGWIRRVT